MKNSLPQLLEAGVQSAISELYATDGTAQTITLQATRKEFEGEFTVVTFPLTRVAKKKPDEIANDLGEYLKPTSVRHRRKTKRWWWSSPARTPINHCISATSGISCLVGLPASCWKWPGMT